MPAFASVPPVIVDITIDEAAWLERLPGVRDIIQASTAAVFESATLDARPDAELSVVLASDATMQALNRDFRQKDNPTNVLSFPSGAPGNVATMAHLGDIILGCDIVFREALDEGKPVEHHLAHLVIHGVLHLFGYDHMTEHEAEEMEMQERKALALLDIPDPYADSDLQFET